MIHKVPYEDVLDLPSSRFFPMAQGLKFRGGAVATLRVSEEEVITPPPPPAGNRLAAGIAAGTADDIAAMAAMSRNDAGFPGIGYSGG